MALISTIRDLHRRKARERRGLALAEGVRLVEEMLAAGVPCKGALVSASLEATPRGVALLTAMVSRGVLVETVDDRELAGVASTEHPQGVVAAYQPRDWDWSEFRVERGRPLLMLDGVQDPGNVGTLARTALAFGAAGMVALPGTVDLTNPKVVRGAAGALFRLPHVQATDEEAQAWLAFHAVSVWATVMDGKPMAAGVPAEPIALLLGNEGAGIRQAWLAMATALVGIPIRAEAESLNVAVAGGILLHHVCLT